MYIYVLIEFQATVDKSIPIRMEEYAMVNLPLNEMSVE